MAQGDIGNLICNLVCETEASTVVVARGRLLITAEVGVQGAGFRFVSVGLGVLT